MTKKPTYEELEQRVKELENEALERKPAEEALRESEQRYRSLFENMLNGFAYCQLLYKDGRPYDFIYLDVNKAFGELTGLQNVVGKRVTKAIPGIKEATPELFDIYAKVAETGSPEQFEINFTPLDIWLNISIYSPQKGYFVAVFENITERKQAEEALRESEEKYRNVVQNSKDGICIIQNTVCRFVNAQLEEMMGANKEELLNEAFFNYVHVDELSKLMKSHERFVSGDEEQQRYETVLVDKSGSYLNVEFNISRTFFDNKKAALVMIRDITEQKRAEDALRESKEKFRLLTEQSLMGVIIIQDGLVKYANEVACEITEYSIEEVLEWKPNEFGKLFHPQDLKFVMEQAQKKQEGAEDVVTHYSYRMLTKSGEVRWVDQYSKTITFEGKTADLISIIDITERKQSEEALRESEERFRVIATNTPDHILVQDKDLRYVWVLNPQLGLTEKEMIGKTDFDITSKEDAAILTEIKKRVLGTGNPEFVKVPLVSLKGDAQHFEGSYIPKRDQEGKVDGLIGYFRNVTDRVKGEEALRESKENLDKAQKLAHIGNWSRDLNFNRAQWSDETYRIFGLTPGDPAQPSFETFLSRVHPGDRERVTSVLKEAAEKKQAFDFEFRTIPIEGSERIIRNRGEVEYDETGTPSRIFGTPQDITETRRLQAQLLEAEKTEAISTLAGGIAHQFNNALSSITGYTGFLEMDYPQDEKITQYTGAMKQSAHRMAHLTDQLLAYARGGKYNPEILSLEQSVKDALPLLQPTLDPSVHVETDLPLDVMKIKADSTQIQMVISAIMSNSNEAMDGPGRIRISTRNMDLDQEFKKDHPGLKPGPYVCLSIEDDGKGMDEETRERIFDPFFTTHFMGRGLGMASVYGIIKNHDGAITVDSEPGKGTVVRIYLPAIEAKEEVKEEVVLRPTVELATGEGTILVIEDEEPLVELFRQILERLGYRVLQARTGKEAVEFAKTFDGQIDLALLDIKLPDMDGGRVYPLIMEARPDLKVIVCSGYSIDGPAQAILDAGAEGFIQKPFSIAPFAEKLKEVLEGK